MRTSTTALRHLLRSLCQNTRWAYAVFWKLKHGNHTTLTWEDAYLDEAKAGVIVENTLHDGLHTVKPGVISSGCARDAWNGSSAGYPIEVIMASMSCQLYSLGEGIIGKVAQTGNHRWIFAAEFNTESSPECSEEWQVQFAVGVKTILLVPVIPHGVVQLGSFDLVMEDSTLVVRIKDLFSTLHHISGTCSSLAPSVDCLNPLSPFAMPLSGSLSVSSALTSDLLNPIQMQQLPTISPNMLQDNVRTSQDVMGHALGTNTRLCKHDNLWNAKYSDLWIDPTEELSLLNGSMYLDKILEGDIPFTNDELGSISHPHDMNHGLTSEHITVSNLFEKDAEHGGYSLPYVKDWTNQEFGAELADINDRSVNLPIDSEQHKILGLGFRNEYDDCVMTSTLQKADKLKHSTAICHTAGPTLNGLLVEESNAWLAKEGDADHLLDVLLADLQYPNDDSLEAFRCIKSCNSSEEYMDSYLTHCKNKHRVFNFGDSSPSNHERLSFVSENEGSTSTPTDSSSKNICMLVNEKQNNHIACDDKNNKGPKSSQNHKRRSRNSKSHKPRPRDRQLIQNRVKELRELIPDGSKCSIDALLHRTVKHMLFLQSISNQAEKLRKSTVPKFACEDWNLKISQTQPNGASWTYQLRSQPEICPLKVENLDQPGQILVEMLCEEYELFLEIAQVIRHLDLIILKGVLSSRSDMLWAHFIVEASRGFHHTHILLPLMQLLQRNQQLLIV